MHWLIIVIFGAITQPRESLILKIFDSDTVLNLWTSSVNLQRESFCFQKNVAQRHFRQPLGGRGPDPAQHLLPPPDAGPDGHLGSGGLQTGPERRLGRADRTQRGDARRHRTDTRLLGRRRLPARRQGVGIQPLTATRSTALLTDPNMKCIYFLLFS